LCHDAVEDAVDEGVERGVADEVVRDVDHEALVRGDGRREGVQDVGEGGQGPVSEFVA
jgi:hypothetical protein